MDNSLLTVNIIATFFIAVLSGLGVGSGGLLVAYLITTSQATQPEARAANLLFFAISAGAAFIFNIRSRRLLSRVIFILASVGICGCLVGAWVSRAVSPEATKKIFGIMLVLSGVYALLGDLSRDKIRSFLSRIRKKRQ